MTYENHLSITKIESKVNTAERFKICYGINKIIKFFPKSTKPSGERTLHILKENEFPHIYQSGCINMAFNSG